MASIEIRRMVKTDLQEITALEKGIFIDPWSLEAFRSDLKNEMALPLVLAVDGKTAGYACLYIVAGEMQIGNFAIAPEFRRRGLARMLMERVVEIAGEHECDSIFLEVRESNIAAKTLYASFEFKVVGRRTGYYRNPKENAILMTREM